MVRRLLTAIVSQLWVLLASTAAPAHAQRAVDVFSFDGEPPVRAIVSERSSIEGFPAIETNMGATLARVHAVLAGADVGGLRACAGGSVSWEVMGETTRRFTIFLQSADATRSVEIHANGSGDLFAVAPHAGTHVVRIQSRRFAALLRSRGTYRGGFAECESRTADGTSATLAQPYMASSVTLNEATLADRLYRGMNVRAGEVTRDLTMEQFHVRVPAGYTPRTPAGLLVWSSPTPDGRVPVEFNAVLDELGLVAIGIDNAGNARATVDKLQLHLDAVATACARFHIDAGRIYICGMSGGGKVSSILTLTFPETFHGCVPIVGLATHHALDASWGDHRYAYVAEPRGERLQAAQQRRIAPISAPADFNYREMVERARRLEADGFQQVRFIEDPHMAHTMPRSSFLAEAVRWVDAPARERLARLEDHGEALWQAFVDAESDLAPAARREALITIINEAPWTEGAWRAYERLGKADGPSLLQSPSTPAYLPVSHKIVECLPWFVRFVCAF